MSTQRKKILFVVNTDWAFVSHRLEIAVAAINKGYDVHIATILTDKAQVLIDYGIKIHPLKMSRSSSGLIDNFIIFFNIFVIFNKVKPDLIHLINIKPVLLGGLAGRILNIPAIVFAVPGLGFSFLDTGFFSILRKIIIEQLYRLVLCANNSKVIFQNKDDQKVISNIANLPISKSALICGSGVDLAVFNVKPWPEGTPLVLMACRLVAEKGVREFVEASVVVRKCVESAGKRVRFVLVGEPDLDCQSKIQISQLNAWHSAGLIEWWGKRSDMNEVLALSSVVVLPSYREGLPKVLIEAAASGRAVVTTDVPGCRDAIEPNVTGILVPAKNTAALADAISEMLQNIKKCKKMGANGRLMAESVFDIHLVVQQHLEIFDELFDKIKT